MNEKKYLIYLKSQDDYEHESDNCYGFYLGKTYQKNYEVFPICSNNEYEILTTGKFYKTENLARRSAETLLLKCDYVLSYEIIEFPSEKFTQSTSVFSR
ncbi:hypothetical protein [Selenomonas ruminantium]|uniref:hypothetical protein n=1 Tax=Selenomonas ruminantium TaxID=971 RepID=UPI0026EA24C4|nr:hypothetical protein [Selenomonas ruminantium]